jgi:hypothetical protein
MQQETVHFYQKISFLMFIVEMTKEALHPPSYPAAASCPCPAAHTPLPIGEKDSVCSRRECEYAQQLLPN